MSAQIRNAADAAIAYRAARDEQRARVQKGEVTKAHAYDVCRQSYERLRRAFFSPPGRGAWPLGTEDEWKEHGPDADHAAFAVELFWSKG